MFVSVFEQLLELKPLTTISSEPKVFVWTHQLTPEAIIHLAHTYLPAWMVENEIANFNGKRLVERLSVRLMFNQLLGADATINYEENGRPYLTSRNAEIGVSHTKNAYAVSLANTRHGLDIEQWGCKALKVKSMFVNDIEACLLSPTTPLACSTEDAATILWSAKEAAYKFKSIAGLSFKQDIELTVLSDKQFEVSFPNHPSQQAQIACKKLDSCVVTCCKNI